MSSTNAFLNLQQCDDSITNAVETVIFDGTSPDHYDLGSEPTLPNLNTIFSLLYCFPNLKALQILLFSETADGDLHHGNFDSYYVQVQQAILEGLACTVLPRLNSLILRSAVPFSDAIYYNDAFLNLFASLTSLSILFICDLRGPPSEDYFSDYFPKVLGAAHNLTSLELGGSTPLGVEPPIMFYPLRLPALTSITFHQIVFAGRSENHSADDFIIAHGGTLQHLALHDCVVPVGDPTSVFWADVFERFRRELRTLITFTWTTRNSGEHTYPYACFHAATHWGHTLLDEPLDIPGDEGALHDLQFAVEARKKQFYG
ncbi:hypothetical protein B0H10DRAFT_2213841 [Mycena sp. CBHHK59/15]|nr:hypothetical protein B0H10DRAFT_2213841 [Mycena sp. CBHHK59/15]